jgi:hypothetical protein
MDFEAEEERLAQMEFVGMEANMADMGVTADKLGEQALGEGETKQDPLGLGALVESPSRPLRLENDADAAAKASAAAATSGLWSRAFAKQRSRDSSHQARRRSGRKVGAAASSTRRALCSAHDRALSRRQWTARTWRLTRPRPGSTPPHT